MLKKQQEIRALILLSCNYIQENINVAYLQTALLSLDNFDMTDYIDSFDSLIADGLLSYNSQDKNYCLLTDTGKSILTELNSLFSDGLIDDAIRRMWRYYESLESGVEYFCDTEECDKGCYLNLGVKINGKTTCSTRVFYADKRDAFCAKKNVQTRPQAVINAILASVSGNIDYLV